jgi:hypothetical protein
MTTKILFIPCYFDGLPRNSGSVRLRAEWVCNHWPGAEVYDYSQPFAGAQLYVFQKAYLVERTRDWTEAAARWRDQGRCRLAFDLCDPDFLDYEHYRRMSRALPLFDFATVTTEAIAKWVERYLPTYIIPDRVDMQALGAIGRKEDTGSTDKPRVVWAGYVHNVSAMDELRGAVEQLGLELTVMAREKPLPFDDFWRAVLEHDVLLNPRLGVAPFSYKSDNKTLIGWALGMPVARNAQELEALCDPEWRAQVTRTWQDEIEQNWQVEKSVRQWEKIVEAWVK